MVSEKKTTKQPAPSIRISGMAPLIYNCDLEDIYVGLAFHALLVSHVGYGEDEILEKALRMGSELAKKQTAIRDQKRSKEAKWKQAYKTRVTNERTGGSKP